MNEAPKHHVAFDIREKGESVGIECFNCKHLSTVTRIGRRTSMSEAIELFKKQGWDIEYGERGGVLTALKPQLCPNCASQEANT